MSAIPNFDHNHVLPPHRGNPTVISDLSPFHCTTLELCQKFATSPERIEILNNFLQFRTSLRNEGLLNAVQWLDGSFLEDIEKSENRPPKDLDIVTIYWGYSIAFQQSLLLKIPEFADPALSKTNLKLDHYPFDAGIAPMRTVVISRYRSQLFSHNRNGVWKGMLAINLNTSQDDIDAIDHLKKLVP